MYATHVGPLRGGLVAWARTFLIVVVGWVFFRANSLDQAVGMLKVMAGMALADGGVLRPAGVCRAAQRVLRPVRARLRAAAVRTVLDAAGRLEIASRRSRRRPLSSCSATRWRYCR